MQSFLFASRLCSSATVRNSPIIAGRLSVNCSGGEQRITDCSIVAEPASSCSNDNQFYLACC